MKKTRENLRFLAKRIKSIVYSGYKLGLVVVKKYVRF